MQKKILIVDDEKTNLQVIIKYLNESGEKYSIMAAPNGKIACKLAEEVLPDLILMDWEMPEMTGIEAVQYLKAKESTKDIVIIMASAQTATSYVEQALNAGALDYIRKPIDGFELIARVKSALKISEIIKGLREDIEKLKKEK